MSPIMEQHKIYKMNQQKIWVTSDLHFGHSNIIKYSPKYRGHLTSVDEMNRELVTNFNKDVSEDDHTYILGDIGFCSPEKVMDFLKQMNGTKTIIHGNHDRKLIASSAFQDRSQRNLAGIVEDTPYKVISQTVDGKKYGVVMFHFRIANWDGAHHGSIHLYGHEHGGGPVLERRCQDIGVDTNALRPYEMQSLIRRLAKKPHTYEGHHDGSRE